jgi:type I restriction enzyme S subunit
VSHVRKERSKTAQFLADSGLSVEPTGWRRVPTSGERKPPLSEAMLEAPVLSAIAEVVDCEHKTAPPAMPGDEFGYSVGTPNLRDGRIDFATAKSVDKVTFRAWSRRATLGEGDLILAREAPVGEVAYINGSEPICLGQRTVLIRCDRNVAEPRYMHYRLLGPTAQRWMADRASGSTVAHLNVADVRQLPVQNLPPVEEQRRIAGVLGALDDLVATNSQLAELADQALLASWSVASGDCQEDSLLGDLVALRKGVSYKGAFLADDGLPLINLGNFGRDGSFVWDGTKHYVGPVKEKQRLAKGELVIANTDLTQRRDILARPILVPFDAATSTHHTFQTDGRGGAAERAWVYCALRSEATRLRLIAYATGTTVAALPADAILTQDIPWDAAAVREWWVDASAYLEAQEGLAEEARLAARTRDELLPLLLSGRVRVDGVAASGRRR